MLCALAGTKSIFHGFLCIFMLSGQWYIQFTMEHLKEDEACFREPNVGSDFVLELSAWGSDGLWCLCTLTQPVPPLSASKKCITLQKYLCLNFLPTK